MFLETPLHTYKFDAIKCDTPDIPIINMDNAILYEMKGSSTLVKQGLTYHNSQFYYFYYDIQSSKYSNLSNRISYAYRIYPVNNELAKRMIDEKYVHYWEVVFSAFFHYNKIWLTYNIGIGIDDIKSFELLSKFDRGLVIPRGISPGLGYNPGMTIGEFLSDNLKNYPKSKSYLITNRILRRELLLNNILLNS